MQKRNLSIFLLFCFLLALVNAGSVSFRKVSTGFQLPERAALYSYSSLKHQPTESQNYTIQATNTFQGNQGFKKLLGYLTYWENRVKDFLIFYLEINSHLNNLFAKEYLSHIYPSHNFW